MMAIKAAALATVVLATSGMARAEVADALRGLPPGVESARDRFVFLKQCSSYRRFKMLFESQRDNPDYPLNNPSALAAMSPIERKMLAERARLVESGSPKCERWMHEVPAQESLWQVHEATLEAARQGDGEAAVCFVMAPWNPVMAYTMDGELQPKVDALRNAYAEFAGEFIDREIKKGSWPMVVQAYHAARAEHGLQTVFAHTQSQSYVWARLMQLGSSDPERKEAYGSEAASYGAGLDAALLSKANGEAERLFRDSFASRLMTDEELYENCGN
jgi:hypothetical protein